VFVSTNTVPALDGGSDNIVTVLVWPETFPREFHRTMIPPAGW
jgi:hypothetical protein